jgi:hypothetical protein
MANGQFIGGDALPTESAAAPTFNPYVYQTPQAGIPQIQGTGGYASPAAAFLSGVAAGQQIVNNASASHRQGQAYNAQQQLQAGQAVANENVRRRAQGLSPLPMPGDQGYSPDELPGVHPSLAQEIVQGARGLVRRMFGNGGAATPAQAPVAGAQGFQRGGVVPEPDHAIYGAVQAMPGRSAFADGGVVPEAAPLPGGTLQPVNPSMAPIDGDPQLALNAAIESAAQRMHGATLDDTGTPQGSYGISPAAPAAPAGPTSLGPDFYDGTDQDALRVATLAARAGHDPNQVYNSMISVRNSWLQGNILRHLSAANIALQTGDQKGVERALHRAYHYFPNGDLLSIHHGPNGEVQYQDPTQPTDADGNPNWVDVTPAHLQMLGQAALNPQTVADTMLKYRYLPTQMRNATMESQAKLYTAQGALLRGQGVNSEGQADLVKARSAAARVASQNLWDQSEAARAAAQAATSRVLAASLATERLSAPAQQNVKQADSLADAAFLGPVQPLSPTDPRIASNPTLYAGAVGKPMRNPALADSTLSKASGTDYMLFKARVQGLAAAGMAAPQAVRLGTQLYLQSKMTHPANQDTSAYAKSRAKQGQIPDVITDSQRGRIWVWNGSTKSWLSYPIATGAAQLLGSGKNSNEQTLLQAIAALNGGTVTAPSGADDNNAPSAVQQDMGASE